MMADEAMVDPLQVWLASAPTALGSTTVTEEEDLLLDVSDVTATEVAARPSPEQAKDSSGDCEPDEKIMFSSHQLIWGITWETSVISGVLGI